MNARARFEKLKQAIDCWLRLGNVDKQIISILVIEKLEKSELSKKFLDEGITFSKTNDPSKDIHANKQKLFRWLGYYQEVKPMPARIFSLEHIIVAAMPEKIRLDYLNDVYGMAGVTAVSKLPAANHNKDFAENISATLTKENAEAQISMIMMGSDPSLEKAKKAQRELEEAIAVGQCALSAIEEKFSDLSN